MEMKLDLSKMISKIILVILFSFGGAFWIANNDKEEEKTAKQLTFESYKANYETYRNSLLHEDDTSFAIMVVIIFMLAGIIFSTYEVFAWLIAALIKVIFKQLGQPHEIRDTL